MIISETIADPLEKLLGLNRTTPSSLRGGAYAITVARCEDGLPWVQAKTGAINLFYPESADPLARLQACLPSPPTGLTCPDWQSEKFATFEFQPISAMSLAKLIEDLFVYFYEFPADTKVSTEIFDMRMG